MHTLFELFQRIAERQTEIYLFDKHGKLGPHWVGHLLGDKHHRLGETQTGLKTLADHIEPIRELFEKLSQALPNNELKISKRTEHSDQSKNQGDQRRLRQHRREKKGHARCPDRTE